MPEITKTSIPVIGLACAACAVSVQSILLAQPGVESASVNYGNRTVRLEFYADKVSLTELRKLVQGIGYDLFLDEENRSEKVAELEHRRFVVLTRKLFVSVIFSIPVFVFSMFFHHSFLSGHWVLFLLSLPVIFYSGSEFYISAWRQFSKRALAMDSLVAVGTGIAFIYSALITLFPSILESQGLESHVYYESAVVIISFVLLGRFLEEKARRRATSSLRSLMGLQAARITIERDGESFDISPSLAVPGDMVLVKAGDRIPVDGEILDGASLVDESAINGESLPRSVTAGSKVFAGTMNIRGYLKVMATQSGNETMLSRVIRLVEDAQSTKPPVQKLVEKISGIFVPVVFLLALFTFAGWLVFDGNLARALVTTISVLIIACPCALGLATPAALIAGIGRGASEGILIRNASVLEMANQVDVIIFDKTGTITEGKTRITHVKSKGNELAEDIRVLLYLESKSNHPLAPAIKDYFSRLVPKELNSDLPFDTIEELAGKGMKAVQGTTSWMIGSERFMNEQGVTPGEARTQIDPRTTTVFFARNADILFEITALDEIRPGAVSAISLLKKAGLETIMVSGDQESTARSVAGLCGIDKVFANILPDEKGEIVKKIQQEGKRVAMIGDGINDAYALAQADLGIAMGSGTDIAMETASVVLMKSDLFNAGKAILLSRATVRIIRQNLFWAFFYNLITIPLAAGLLYPVTGFLLNPMIAGAAMAMSSVSVMLNSLRLKWQEIS